jgi:hypothetical protein
MEQLRLAAAIPDDEMLSRRTELMNLTATQLALSAALELVGALRRVRPIMLLSPFFAAAALLGHLGARRANTALLSAHFFGSSGLSLVLGIFILATATLKRDSTDVLFFALNGPMDAFMLVTSLCSLRLFLALSRLRRGLATERTRMLDERHEQTRVFEAALADNRADFALRRHVMAHAAETRRAARGGYEGVGGGDESASSALLRDLRCPISLEVMSDPVIAADGHSYERVAIQRWLEMRRTSPMTGAILNHAQLVPNHRLRAIIDDLSVTLGLGGEVGGRAADEPAFRVADESALRADEMGVD